MPTTYISKYPVHDNDHVRATSANAWDYMPYFATDPAKSLTGDPWRNCWSTNGAVNYNQRFHIDLGTAEIVKRVYHEGYHNYGTETTKGPQNFTLWGSNNIDDYLDVEYSHDNSWTQLVTDTSVFAQHASVDASDPHYILVTNTVAYRFYSFKFAGTYDPAFTTYMGLRRVELQVAVVSVQQDILSDSFCGEETAQTIDANASIYITASQTIFADSFCGEETEQVIDANANIHLVTSRTIFADAFCGEETSRTILNNAHIGAETVQAVNSNSTILVTVQQSIDAGADIAGVTYQNINAQSFIVQVRTQEINSSAVVITGEPNVKLFMVE